jgi:hypothetical protein
LDQKGETFGRRDHQQVSGFSKNAKPGMYNLENLILESRN